MTKTRLEASPRILVIGGYAPSLINFRMPLLRGLVDKGYSVSACAPEVDDRVSDALAALGIGYSTTPMRRAGMNPMADIMYWAALVRLMAKVRPTHVLAYTIKAVIWGLLAARARGVRNRCGLITGLGYAFGEEGSGWLRRLVVALYHQSLAGCTKAIFQNPDDQRLFIELGIVEEVQTSIVNGSGVDTSYFALHRPLPSAPAFLMVARLLRDKGLLEYVEAAKRIADRYPRAQFSLLGPIDSNPLGLGHQEIRRILDGSPVNYLGQMDDVRPSLRDCSILVLPSYREGMPRTVLEAMSMGRPVIATDVPGCRQAVVHGQTGLLVSPRDSLSLAEAMAKLIENPQLWEEMGARGRRRVEEMYRADFVASQTIAAMGL